MVHSSAPQSLVLLIYGGFFVSSKSHKLIKKSSTLLNWTLTSENKSWTEAEENKRQASVQWRPGAGVSFPTPPWGRFVCRLYLWAPNSRQSSSDLSNAPVKTHHSPARALTSGNTGKKGAPENTGKQARKRTEETSRSSRKEEKPPAFPITEESQDTKACCPPESTAWAALASGSAPGERLGVSSEPSTDRLCKQPRQTVSLSWNLWFSKGKN